MAGCGLTWPLAPHPVRVALALLSLVLVELQSSMAGQGAAPAVGALQDDDDDSDPSRQIIFTTVVQARRLEESEQSSLTQQVAAPTQIASSATMAVQIGDRTWHVPMHVPMEAFLYTSGPPEIVRYNFKLVRRLKKEDLVRRQAYLPGGRHSAADVLVLTPLGELRLPTSPALNVWQWEMACSGTSAHGKEPPNCQRACGGIGCCLEGCRHEKAAHHSCTVRVVVTASLDDVAHHRWHVAIKGHHVPPGTAALPPPLNHLSLGPTNLAR